MLLNRHFFFLEMAAQAHKELQERLVPDLLKHFKSWQAALHCESPLPPKKRIFPTTTHLFVAAASAEAISKVGDAWLRIADSVGRDSDWGINQLFPLV